MKTIEQVKKKIENLEMIKTITQANAHAHPSEPSHEINAMVSRLCEMQIELLEWFISASQ